MNGDYMKSVLNIVGVDTLEELIVNPDFIEYCKRFDDPMMTNFKDKVESYIGSVMKKNKTK
jgi:hypothetical protein